jgi:hypothetical protein
MRPAEPAELFTQRPIPVRLDGLVTLGAAVLADQLARPPLGYPKHLLERFDGAAPADPGSPGSPPQLLQRLDLQLLVGHDPLQPGVLALQLLEALDVVALSPPSWARQRWEVASLCPPGRSDSPPRRTNLSGSPQITWTLRRAFPWSARSGW